MTRWKIASLNMHVTVCAKVTVVYHSCGRRPQCSLHVAWLQVVQRLVALGWLDDAVGLLGLQPIWSQTHAIDREEKMQALVRSSFLRKLKCGLAILHKSPPCTEAPCALNTPSQVMQGLASMMPCHCCNAALHFQ